MATTLGTIQVLNAGAARVLDDLAHRGITPTLSFTASNDLGGGSLGTLAVTIPDSATNNTTWGAMGQLYGIIAR